MKPGTDHDPHEAFLRAWSIPASRKQKARAHSSGEAEYYAAASDAGGAMLIREVLLFTGVEVRTELLVDSLLQPHVACADVKLWEPHVILSTKVLWLQQSVKRGVVWLERVHPQRIAQTWRDKAVACP